MEVFDFGKRLAQMRQHKHLTQTQVAERLGLSRMAISAYERNLKKPSVDTLVKLALLYDTSLDYLTGLIDRVPSDLLNGFTPRQKQAALHILEILRTER